MGNAATHLRILLPGEAEGFKRGSDEGKNDAGEEQAYGRVDDMGGVVVVVVGTKQVRRAVSTCRNIY